MTRNRRIFLFVLVLVLDFVAWHVQYAACMYFLNRPPMVPMSFTAIFALYWVLFPPRETYEEGLIEIRRGGDLVRVWTDDPGTSEGDVERAYDRMVARSSRARSICEQLRANAVQVLDEETNRGTVYYRVWP